MVFIYLYIENFYFLLNDNNKKKDGYNNNITFLDLKIVYNVIIFYLNFIFIYIL